MKATVTVCPSPIHWPRLIALLDELSVHATLQKPFPPQRLLEILDDRAAG